MHDVMHAMGTAHDFDFLFGRWNVHNRRLRERLVGLRTSGRSSRAEHVARPLLDGMGNEDEFRTDHDGGMIGMSFRFFDPKTRLWSIYWADSRRCGLLDPPVVGSFADGIGMFEGDRHARGQADPRALHLVADRDRRSRAGSRRSPPTAARPGRRTGSWSSRRAGDER